jgi:hypothetical protein
MNSTKAIKERAEKDHGNAQRKKYILSKNPNKAMEEMMVTIDRLRSSLIEETAALKEADTTTFMHLQDKKLDVARDYLEGMGQMLARKDEIKQADPTLIDRLEKMRGEFADIAHENHAALERMKNGMKRLGDRIMETARETARKEKEIIYGSSGQMQSGLKATIGINESA